MSDRKRFHIGCQSWGYDDWVTPAAGETVFYPRGTKRDEMLGLYSQIFDTIEVDSTLYGIPPASTLRNWYDETPAGFIFSLKFPREITHDHRLRGSSVRIMNEFVKRSLVLREKLGIMLIQFPASFEPTADNTQSLQLFLSELPSDHRFAMEFRNTDWFAKPTFDQLEKAGVSLCLVEGTWIDRDIMFKFAESVASSFAYVRFMGKRGLAKFDRISRNRDDVLNSWKPVVAAIDRRNIFIYVDNYFEGFAPATANKLHALLDLKLPDPAKLERQGSLF